jgi:uncharacterized OsmC-like protein
MAIEVFKANAKLTTGITIECETRGHKLILDEPEGLGGNDKGMNPVEDVLCALGACQAIVARAFAESKGINLKEFWVELEGDLDPDGFQGLSDVRPGFQAIRTIAHVNADNTEEEIKNFVKFVENTCPVADTIKHSAKMSSEVILEK